MPNWSLSSHKLTVGFALLSAAATYFLPLFPVRDEVVTATMGFLGVVGMLVKTFQDPPVKEEAKP